MTYSETLADRIAWSPDRADRILLAGGETAIDTIASILAMLPATARGQVFVEVASLSDVQVLAAPGRFGISWLVRDRGQSLSRSVDAWLSEMLPISAFTANSVYAWIEGESHARVISSD
ncbi:MAG: SIP domain-containing protein [Salinibacterium sp.]|nr:SIP domain-containing protein [Salinibacterium sp.]